MHRRTFLPTIVTALTATAAVPRLLAAAEAPAAADPPRRRARRRGGLMQNPKFDALSFEGKRLIEYARPFLKKLPRPGPGLVGGWLLAYDELSARQQRDLEQLLVYAEYMSKQELAAYLGADPEGGRMDRAALEEGLKRLAVEARIPYHTGAKVVVTALGPWTDRGLTVAPPAPGVMPHAARDLMPAGTWYENVAGVATTLPAFASQILRGGAAAGSSESSVTAVLRERGLPREAVWSILGSGTNATGLGRGESAPYVLSTADARMVDTYLERTGFRKKMRMAQTPEEKRALRKEIRGLREQAIHDLKLEERYPDAQAVQFVSHVMFGERGIKDRGNTFVHVGGLRAMQLVHPKFLYVQFGGPDEALRRQKRGRGFGEQGAVGQGNYTDADYLLDVDQWSYYHWLEAQRHPHYEDETTFVLLFGPQPGGTTQAIVTGPGVAAGARERSATGLPALLAHAIRRVA